VDRLNLTRRPLKTLSEGIREPHKADRLTNRARRIDDRFNPRRFNRAGYNRKEREHYKKRPPQRTDPKRKNVFFCQTNSKRHAPEKRGPFGRLRKR
jgi:hypothetical protein